VEWSLNQNRRASTGQDCRSCRRQIRILNKGTIPDSALGIDGGVQLTSNAGLARYEEVGVERHATCALGIYKGT